MIEIVVAESEEVEREVGAGLRDANAAASPEIARWYASDRPEEPLHVAARNAEGTIVGGVTGSTASALGWCQINRLWVAETHRGTGLGTRLMLAAEAEALRRGCRHVRLETVEFQAPEFYRKLGYVEYGRLEGSVGVHAELMLRKDLEPPE